MEHGIRIKEAPVKAVYGGQSSGIKIFTFLPVVSWMLLKGLFSRGIRWYLLGQSKATFTQRATISIGFLGGSALLFSIPLIGPVGLCGIFGLGVARKVDATLLRQLETTQVDPRV
jgi:hypothetical protein